MGDGTGQVRESYGFSKFAADGRFETVEEVTLVAPVHEPRA